MTIHGAATPEQCEIFRRDGVVLIPGFLAGDEVDRLAGALHRFISMTAPSLHDGSVIKTAGGSVRALENLAVDSFFDSLGRSSKWTSTAAALLGSDVCPAVRDQYSEWGWQEFFSVPPGADEPTPPHQDNYYYNWVPPITCSLWVALDAVDDSNGAVRYVLGSHAKGLRPHRLGEHAAFSQVVDDFGPDDEAREISFQLWPGDLVAHHGQTIHRSLPNVSGRRRWAFAMFFRAQDCRRDEDVHADYARSLEEHQRRHSNLQHAIDLDGTGPGPPP
jgi:phytanoyl-CoA hydroxylase